MNSSNEAPFVELNQNQDKWRVEYVNASFLQSDVKRVSKRAQKAVGSFRVANIFNMHLTAQMLIYLLQGNNLLDTIEDNQALAIVSTDERAFYEVDNYCELIAMPVRSSL